MCPRVGLRLLLAASLGLLWQCAPHGGKESPRPVAKAAEADLVAAAWRQNEAIIRKALDLAVGEEMTTESFSSALSFFERLTGIQSDTMTTVGRLPVESLHGTLIQWNAWYKENSHLLYWDKKADQVRIRRDSR